MELKEDDQNYRVVNAFIVSLTILTMVLTAEAIPPFLAIVTLKG